jgi:uncharacterized protein (TIGR03435 family)
MVQGGDFAPELTFTSVVRSPDEVNWRHENFVGRLTIVVFFPNLSDTTEAFAALWNKLVERFAGEKVQFVLIARDDQADLELWLKRNPIQGWLLRDSNWETAHNWGMGMPQVAFIDRDGRILGFSDHALPNDFQIVEILAGRVNKARIRPKPHLPDGDKPDVEPSYTVHVSPTKREPEEGTSASSGPDHWTALGFELKAVIAEVYGEDETRIDFPAALDNGQRYDFAILLPEEETREKMYGLVQQAIEQRFGVSITRESRAMDVYVLTAPDGEGPDLREVGFGGGGFMSSSSSEIPWTSADGKPPTTADFRKASASIRNISGSGQVADLCKMLERGLDRLVVDEAGLAGIYEFHAVNKGNNNEAFFQALRDGLGLVATPDKREVAMLIVRQV